MSFRAKGCEIVAYYHSIMAKFEQTVILHDS